jgi:glutaminase
MPDAQAPDLASPDLASIVHDIAAEMRLRAERGTVADYIPALATVSPDRFGIAVVIMADGTCHTAGDADEAFSIQSISKVFALTMALGAVGDALWQRGANLRAARSTRSSSSKASMASRATRSSMPAPSWSAISCWATTNRARIGEMLRFVRALAPTKRSWWTRRRARRAGDRYRNMALANYMRAFGNVRHPVEKVLGLYFHQCAIAMSCRQLPPALPDGARAPSRYRAQRGLARRARRINALMLTCGHYDGSGEFAFRTGLPGKSGVGGASWPSRRGWRASRSGARPQRTGHAAGHARPRTAGRTHRLVGVRSGHHGLKPAARNCACTFVLLKVHTLAACLYG